VSLTQAIKNEAHRMGFSLVGVTTPDPPPHWLAFEKWLSMGRHASMDYLVDHRRANPHLLFPECRSILVLAVRYPNPGLISNKETLQTTGCVAAYAWSRDYHLVLPERLKTLVSFIETRVGIPVPHRWYTDTGPLLERDLAQRAGLGWIGRNTCLIHPGKGSYFLLAEILLGIELETDPPFIVDRCGRCNRCITACPTGCILPDRTLDARRCLSYLTIENKADIPPELRPSLGNRVFGCDICQQVCPWNRFSGQEFDPAFAAQFGLPNPDLVAELALTSQEFTRKFKGNPVMRSKRRGYLRNIAVALGNSKNPSALPALEKAIQDPEPLIQEHAAWALEQIHPDKTLPGDSIVHDPFSDK
jgi:epoxyqueuosine reductase